MADNVTIPAQGTGTATPVIATDDVAGVHYQKVKIALGADGAVDTLVDSGQQLSADSVPVVLASDHSDVKVTLDGEPVAISGTVTVNGSGVTQPISAAALPLPSGAATAANQSTGNSSLAAIASAAGATTDAEATGDGTVIAILKRLRTLIGDIFSTVGNIYTSLGVLTMGDNSAYTATMDRVFAVGGYMDDASPNTLSEGNIGTLRVTTNRAVHVNLRDASGNELTPGGTQYTEDAGAAANPTGTALIMVRDDSRVGSITNADGDNIAVRGNNKGEMYVKDTDAETVLNGILTSLGYIQPDTTLIATETGNAAALLTSLAGALASVGTDALIIAEPLQVQSSGADVATEVTLGAVQSAVEQLVAALFTQGGDSLIASIIDGHSGITAGAGGVAENTPRVTLAGDDENLTMVNESLSDISGNTFYPGQNMAATHDAPDAGNPIKIGHRAKNFDGTAPGIPVDEDDRVNSIADVYGRQYVEITHPAHWTVSADYASAQTNTSLKSAPGAGLKLYITDVIVSNGATAGNVTLLNGSGGAVLLELYPGVNGGMAMPFRTPIALSANTALCITSTTVTTHSVTICGYTAP